MRLYFRLSTKGEENLPLERSFVIVANHASHLDAFCLGASLPLEKTEDLCFTAARDYFFPSRFFRLFFRLLMPAIFFNRGKHSQRGFEQCQDFLREKQKVLILFPEGRRSQYGDLLEFKWGIGALLAGTDIPVVPAFIEGSHLAWPRGSYFPRPKKVRVNFGKPLLFSHIQQSKEGYQFIAKTLQNEIGKMQREPLDEYSPIGVQK